MLVHSLVVTEERRTYQLVEPGIITVGRGSGDEDVVLVLNAPFAPHLSQGDSSLLVNNAEFAEHLAPFGFVVWQTVFLACVSADFECTLVGERAVETVLLHPALESLAFKAGLRHCV